MSECSICQWDGPALEARLEEAERERDAEVGTLMVVLASKKATIAQLREALERHVCSPGSGFSKPDDLRRALSSESFEILLPPDATYKVD